MTCGRARNIEKRNQAGWNCGQNCESVCGRLAARRIHEDSGSNQARREKARKAVRQGTAPIEWNTSGSKSFGRFDQPRTRGRKEVGDVCGCESADFEGNKSAMGKV